MADFNEYKGVWVFCEQRQGALMSTDFELVSEARKLADELGCEVTGLLLGDNVEGIAKELGGYGADKVMVCDSPLLKDYTTDAYAKVVCDMVNEYKPEVLLIGATNIGRDLGPRCAARLHTGLTADATHLDISSRSIAEKLGVTKPSVVRILNLLMEQGMIVKEYYGKIYLTDRGIWVAKRVQQELDAILAHFPPVSGELTDEEKWNAALAMTSALPQRLFTADYERMVEGEEEKHP